VPISRYRSETLRQSRLATLQDADGRRVVRPRAGVRAMGPRRTAPGGWCRCWARPVDYFCFLRGLGSTLSHGPDGIVSMGFAPTAPSDGS
jgi:hypothetical protein